MGRRGCEGVEGFKAGYGRRGGGRPSGLEGGEELDVLVGDRTELSECRSKYGLEFVDVEPFSSTGLVGNEDEVDRPAGRGQGWEGEGWVLGGGCESHLKVGEGGKDFDVLMGHDVCRSQTDEQNVQRYVMKLLSC